MSFQPPNLIYDQDMVREFYNRILKRGTHVLQLQSRPKYGGERDRIYQRVRADCSDFDYFLHKVAQACQVPPDAEASSLVLYSTTNPIDVSKTNLEVTKVLIDQMADTSSRRILSADRLWFHSAPKHALTKDDDALLTFDVDVKESIGDIMAILSRFDIKIAEIVETRGGYHIFVERKEVKAKSCKAFIDSLKFLTFVAPARDGKMISHQVSSFPKNTLCAIPGTLQGGFPVRLLNPDEFPSLDS